MAADLVVLGERLVPRHQRCVWLEAGDRIPEREIRSDELLDGAIDGQTILAVRKALHRRGLIYTTTRQVRNQATVLAQVPALVRARRQPHEGLCAGHEVEVHGPAG